ncbi:MAG: methyltransferase domain-containing protein, partial [Candidatus Omnitrophica bacterium]|nr:methyltransferase domain-containing protein [Candidatus Omnitrophota bacterium]
LANQKTKQDKINILDLGCGYFSALILSNLGKNNIYYTGIDIDSWIINFNKIIAKLLRRENVEYRKELIGRLSDRDNSIDLIIVSSSEIDINEIKRVLKPNGTILITAHALPVHAIYEALLRKAGFEFVDMGYSTSGKDWPNTYIIARKPLEEKTGRIFGENIPDFKDVLSDNILKKVKTNERIYWASRIFGFGLVASFFIYFIIPIYGYQILSSYLLFGTSIFISVFLVEAVWITIKIIHIKFFEKLETPEELKAIITETEEKQSEKEEGGSKDMKDGGTFYNNELVEVEFKDRNGQIDTRKLSAQDITEEFFEEYLIRKQSFALIIPKGLFIEFPYWTKRYKDRPDYATDDRFKFYFRFSKLREDLDLYDEICRELELINKIELKIKRKDIEASPKILLKLFAAIKIKKFIELISLYSIKYKNPIKELESIITSSADKYLLHRAVFLWGKSVGISGKEIVWYLEEKFADEIEKKNKPEIKNKVKDTVTYISKEIIYSLDNEVYVYKNYNPKNMNKSVIFYLVYAPKPEHQIAVTVSLKEENNNGYIHKAAIMESEDIDRLVSQGSIIQINSQGRIAYKAAALILKRHRISYLEEWIGYFDSIKLDANLADIYLKLFQYISNNKNSFLGYSFERFFFKSYSLLHSTNQYIKDRVLKILEEINRALDNKNNKNGLAEDKLKGFAGEISGIYEFAEVAILGGLSFGPIKATRVRIKAKDGRQQEWDAIGLYEAFEFKYKLWLFKFYTQVFGIGRNPAYLSYIESLAYGYFEDKNIGVEIKNIRNLIYFGETLPSGEFIKEALKHFIDNNKGEPRLAVNPYGKSILIRFDLPMIMKFLKNKKTIELTKRELGVINNGYPQKMRLYNILNDDGEIEKSFNKCEEIINDIKKRTGNLPYVIIAVSNFGEIPESMVQDQENSKDGGRKIGNNRVSLKVPIAVDLQTISIVPLTEEVMNKYAVQLSENKKIKSDLYPMALIKENSVPMNNEVNPQHVLENDERGAEKLRDNLTAEEESFLMLLKELFKELNTEMLPKSELAEKLGISKKNLSTHNLLNSLINKGWVRHFSNLKDKYYEELQILRGYHYPHRLFKRIMKKHYEPYPEVANALIYLARMVIILKELNEILPRSSHKRVQRWKNKIEQELNRPEIKEFLKRESFLEAISGAEYSPYLFLSIKELGKYIKNETHKDGTFFINDENLNSIKAAISLQMKLKEEAKLNILRKEISGIVKIFSNLWNKDTPSYIRHFPNNMTMILNEMGYYSCIAMAILENDHKWINIAKPTGTINLVSYKNPLLNAKTTHVRPITINLNNRKNALLLSGPNMGGKTMTGRAIGLAVLLNQAVLPIPAEETLGLGLFRNIYTVFPRPEHMHKGYGYFEALVKELTEIIKEAERNGNVFGDMEGNDSEQKLLGESLPALVEKLTKERESVLEHNGKDGGAAKDANRLRKVEEPQDKVLEKVMSALVEVSGSGLIQENRFARTLIEDAKWVANLSKTNRELALGAILYPFAGDKPTASTEAVSHYTIIIARLRQSFREHGTLLLDYIMDYVLKSLKVTPGGTDAPPKNSKVIDDPARANKELTNEAKEALAKIVTSSIVEKLDLTETSADTVMKRTIADYLSKKGYRHLGVILGNTLVVRAPPDSELVEKIKEFEQKYGVIVYAVNLPAIISPTKQNIIILINHQEKELIPSLFYETGVLSGFSYKECRELERMTKGLLGNGKVKPLGAIKGDVFQGAIPPEGSAGNKRASVLDEHLSKHDEFAEVLREIDSFGPQGKPSQPTLKRRKVLIVAYPEIVRSVRDYFEEEYPNTDFSKLNIVIIAGGSTLTGVAQDGSDLDLYFLIDDSGLPEEVKLQDRDKRKVVIKTREVISKIIDERGLMGIRKHHPTQIKGKKVWFLRDILRKPERHRFDRPMADAFLVCYGPVESVRRKLLSAIAYSGLYKKWGTIQKKWSSYVNGVHLKRLDTRYVPSEGLSFKLPDLTTMLTIYNIPIPDGMIGSEQLTQTSNFGTPHSRSERDAPLGDTPKFKPGSGPDSRLAQRAPGDVEDVSYGYENGKIGSDPGHVGIVRWLKTHSSSKGIPLEGFLKIIEKGTVKIIDKVKEIINKLGSLGRGGKASRVEREAKFSSVLRGSI